MPGENFISSRAGGIGFAGINVPRADGSKPQAGSGQPGKSLGEKTVHLHK
jgi:hypothetical protein